MKSIDSLKKLARELDAFDMKSDSRSSLTKDLKRVFEIIGEQANALSLDISVPKILEIFEMVNAGGTDEGMKLYEKLVNEIGK